MNLFKKMDSKEYNNYVDGEIVVYSKENGIICCCFYVNNRPFLIKDNIFCLIYKFISVPEADDLFKRKFAASNYNFSKRLETLVNETVNKNMCFAISSGECFIYLDEDNIFSNNKKISFEFFYQYTQGEFFGDEEDSYLTPITKKQRDMIFRSKREKYCGCKIKEMYSNYVVSIKRAVGKQTIYRNFYN
jgi:hypothetical protein